MSCKFRLASVRQNAAQESKVLQGLARCSALAFRGNCARCTSEGICKSMHPITDIYQHQTVVWAASELVHMVMLI